jgi:hypothetical protein
MKSIVIITTKRFAKGYKSLHKRYKTLDKDFEVFKENLMANPQMGVMLEPNIRKVRMAISAKGKGKSGGARVITLDVLHAAGLIVLLALYDKSDRDSMDIREIYEIIREEGLD